MAGKKSSYETGRFMGTSFMKRLQLLQIGPGQGQAGNPRRAARQENLAAFGERRAGGADIIDKEKMPPGNGVGGWGEGKSVL